MAIRKKAVLTGAVLALLLGSSFAFTIGSQLGAGGGSGGNPFGIGSSFTVDPGTGCNNKNNGSNRAAVDQTPSHRFGIGSSLDIGSGGANTSSNVDTKSDRFGLGSSFTVDPNGNNSRSDRQPSQRFGLGSSFTVDPNGNNSRAEATPSQRFGIGSSLGVGKGGASSSVNVDPKFGLGSSFTVDPSGNNSRFDGEPTQRFGIGSSLGVGKGGASSSINVDPKKSDRFGLGSSFTVGSNNSSSRADNLSQRFGIGSSLDVGQGDANSSFNVNPNKASNRFTIGSSFGVGKDGVDSSVNVDPNAGKKPAKKQQACGFPNGTISRLHVFNCDPELPLEVTSAKVVNAKTGRTLYPLRNNVPIAVELELDNKGEEIQSDKLNITLSEYGANENGECDFIELPVSNVLSDLDGCELAHDCPVKEGESAARIPLDLSRFAEVVKQLKRNKVYQLKIDILDNNDAQLGCVISQGRVI